MRIRVLGAPTDLHAADAQYHRACYLSFIPDRNVRSAQNKKVVSNEEDDTFRQLIDVIYNDPSRIWTSVELHTHYINICNHTNAISRKQLICKLQVFFGDDLIKLDIAGCASLFCLSSHLPDFIRLVKVDSTEAVPSAVLRDQIIAECQEIHKPQDYDLAMFTNTRAIHDTSPTLLEFVAGLVSDGDVNRTSIALSQSIQGHVTKTFNQTTFGLAVKLHHKFGSRELIDTLHTWIHMHISRGDTFPQFSSNIHRQAALYICIL